MATVGFGLESANVVGYNNNDLRTGNKGVGACFLPIGADAVKLNELKVSGYDPEAGCEGDVYVQTLDNYGRTIDMYFWYDVPGELYGWLDIDDNEVDDTVKFNVGEGIYANAPSADYKFMSAGEVAKEDISVILRTGNKHVVNATPVAIKLNDVVIAGYDPEEGCEGDVYVQTLDNYGRTIDMYFWYDVPGELYGWLDINDNEVEDSVKIPAGDSVYANSPSAAYSIIFPAPSL